MLHTVKDWWQHIVLAADQAVARARAVSGQGNAGRFQDRSLSLDELEPRVLFSATPIDPALLAEAPAAMVVEIDAPTNDNTTQPKLDVTSESQSATEIIIIDASTPDLDQFLDDLSQSGREADVFVLDADRDGIDQITEILNGRSNVDSLHIVSHGGVGEVTLGNVKLSSDTLSGYAGAMASWQSAFDTDADILFYGCDLAGDAGGQLFVESISTLTGTNVAASDDATGHESLGGDWELEFGVGVVDTQVAFSESFQNAWFATLPANTAPVNIAPAFARTDADTPHVYSTKLANGIRVFDADAGSDLLTVDLMITNGTLTLGNLDAATLLSGTGVAHTAITIEGSLTEINTALDGLTYTPTTGFLGRAELTITTNDQGNNGTGGALVDTDEMVILVGPELDATGEFQVNPTGPEDSSDSDERTSDESRGRQDAVAIHTDGTYVVVWSDDSRDNGHDVFAQRFDARGATIGQSFRVNDTAGGDQRTASIDMDSQGRFAVVWTGEDASGEGIFMRRFNADGSAIDSSDVAVNTTTDDNQTQASISVNDAGQVFIAWQSDGANTGIFYNEFDIAGGVGSGEGVATSAANAQHVSIDGNQSGDFVVVWQDDGIWRRRFGSQADAGPVEISNATSVKRPVVLYQDDGHMIVAWDASPGPGDRLQVQAFDETGAGGAVLGIDTDLVSFASTHANLASDGHGNVLLSWQSSFFSRKSAFVSRLFTNASQNVGITTRVEISTTDDGVREGLSVAVKDANNFVAVWTGRDGAGTNNVFARQFGAGNTEGLLLSTLGDGDATGLSFDAGSILQFGGAGMNLEPGAPTTVTSGTFTELANSYDFNEDGATDVGIQALHVVTRDLIVGTGESAFQLLKGDILYALDGDTTLATGQAVQANDILIQRPIGVGRLQDGSQGILFDDVAGVSQFQAFTLVEQDTLIGDVVVSAGDFLFTPDDAGSNEDQSIWVWHTESVGLGTTTGSTELLVQGSDIGVTEQIDALELVEYESSLGGAVVAAGTLLLSTAADGDVGDNALPITDSDVFGLTITTTNLGSGVAAGNGYLLFEGDEAGLSDPSEDVKALSFTGQRVQQANFAPILDNTGDLHLNDIFLDIPDDRNTGTTILEVLESHSGTSVLTDANSDPLGIAIVGVDNSNGTWEYTTDGANWNAIGSVSTSSALLLADDGLAENNRIRFVPNQSWTGTATITIYGWDGTAGSNGDQNFDIDAVGYGGNTSFSVANETVSVVVDSTPHAQLWLSTNVTTTAGITWNSGDIVAFSGEEFAPGSTAGTFSVDSFYANDIRALHYVNTPTVVGDGDNSFQLLNGDILMSFNGITNLPGLSGNFTVAPGDIVLYRPSDGGAYRLLLDDPITEGGLLRSMHGFTLVEKDTVVSTTGTGTTLQEGSFLILRSNDADGTVNEHAQVYVYTPTEVALGASGNTSQNADTLLLDEIGLGLSGAEIQGIELLESDVVLGDETFLAGGLLLSIDRADTFEDGDGNNVTNLNANAQDIVLLDISETEIDGGGNTVVAATEIFDGLDVSLTAGIDALTLRDSVAQTFDTAPVADASAGGPYEINEGDAVTFDASLSYDPDTVDSTGLTYDWDVNNDGSFERNGLSVATVDFAWADLVAAGAGDDGTYQVAVRVSDSDGNSSTDLITLDVTNVAPTILVNGGALTGTGSEGVAYTITLDAADPGDDTVTNWIIDWGDGTLQEVADAASYSHTYTSGGNYNVLVAAIDEDGTHLQNKLLVPSYTNDGSVFVFDPSDGLQVNQFGSSVLQDSLEVIVGPNGNLFVSSFQTDEIWEFTRDGDIVDGDTGTAGIQPYLTLPGPTGMAFDTNGDLWVATSSNDRIRHYHGSGFDEFDVGVEVTGMEFHPNGDLFFVDDANGDNGQLHRLRGGTVTSSGAFSRAQDIAIGPNGNIYVADAGNQRVQIFDANGVYIDEFNMVDSTATAAAPYGLAFGPDKLLYITVGEDGGSNADDQVLRYKETTGVWAFHDSFTDGSRPGVNLDYGVDLNFLPEHQVTIANAADTPSVTAATTAEDTQTTSGLVITQAPLDTSTHYKITGISGGLLFLADGTTAVTNGSFITVAEGAAGLRFTPAADLNSLGATPTQFSIQASLNANDAGLGGNVVQATINVAAVNDAPLLTSTPLNRTYTEGAGEVLLFTATNVDTVEPGDLIQRIELTFDGVANGADETLQIDSEWRSLVTSSGPATIASGYLLDIDTSTGVIAITRPGNFTAVQAEELIDTLMYANNSDTPVGTNREFTISLIQDDGGGASTTVLAITSDVAIVATNDASSLAGVTAGQTVSDNALLNPFSTAVINDIDGDDVSVAISLMGAEANGQFTAVSLAASGFVKTSPGNYALSATTPTAAQAAIRLLDFDPTDNQVAVGSSASTTFKVDIFDGSVTTTNSITSVAAFSVNDAPTISSAVLASIGEDNFDPPGESFNTLLSAGASDADHASAFAGVAITANPNNIATEGTWQYSSDGTNWFSIGTVSDNNSLVIASSSLVRFVPVANFQGSPQNLSLRAVDDSYSGSFSTTAGFETRHFADTSSPSPTSFFSTSTAEISTTVTDSNDAPTISDAQLPDIDEDDFNSPGQTINGLFASSFADSDAGSSLAGVAVVGNPASADTEGFWQYSSDGVNWRRIGSVDDSGNGLAINAASRIRFVPVANYHGSPGVLSLRALDNTYTGTFSDTTGTESRKTVDTSTASPLQSFSTAVNQLSTTVLAVNDSPVIADANVNLLSGESVDLSEALFERLASDADGDPVTGIIVAQPSNGTLTTNPDGSLTYIPSAGVCGVDSFQVQAFDGSQTSDTGTITLTVAPPLLLPSIDTDDLKQIDEPAETEEEQDEAVAEVIPSIDPGAGTEPETKPRPRTAVTIAESSDEEEKVSFFEKKTDEGLPTSRKSAEFAARQLARSTQTKEFFKEAATQQRSQVENTASRIDYAMMTGPGELWSQLDAAREQQQSVVQGELIKLGATGSVVSGFTVGFVAWALRGGFLLSGLLTQMPAWKSVDPMLIMQGLEGDGETLEDIIESERKALDSEA